MSFEMKINKLIADGLTEDEAIILCTPLSNLSKETLPIALMAKDKLTKIYDEQKREHKAAYAAKSVEEKLKEGLMGKPIITNANGPGNKWMN